MAPTRVVILLGGLLNGPDGYVTSSGLYALKAPLEKIPGVTVSIYPWGQWQQAANEIYDVTKCGHKTAVIGYSGGGKAATWINYYKSVGMDLLIAWDPSPERYMRPIRNNVKKAICFYNEAPLMLGLGGGLVEYDKVSCSNKVEVIPIRMQHLLVQAMPSLHTRTVEEVRKLAT